MTKQIWSLKNNALYWQVEKGFCHRDDIEMSGLYADYIVYYGVKEDGTLYLSQRCYFPTLRTIPNNTHGTFCFALEESERPVFIHDGEVIKEYPVSFVLDGTLKVNTKTEKGICICRCFFPATDSKCCYERVTVTAEKEAEISLSLPQRHIHSYGRGTKGVYICEITNTAARSIYLDAGDSYTLDIIYSARKASEALPLFNGRSEYERRMQRAKALCEDALVLETDCPELDAMTRFAKLRAGESIFETATGKYHSPGGHAYYAATWCNDEAEYAGPHFAMTGDRAAIDASINAYRSYIPFMSDCYHKLPCSIIAEGLDIWEGAGDRGDAAMYLYGASLFCLYLGDKRVAESLYPAIKWCAEYCERQKTPEGVIRSDSDELEGRFPTDGYANLSTSSLCCGGLKFASRLARSLGDEETAEIFAARADSLEKAIENYFGATLHGFETYRYSKGFDTLRAWICLPLCMGINTRVDGTLDAMLSQYLWTEEGMLTCEKGKENTSDTIWDRSTLYGIKCAFLASAGDRIIQPFLDYCHKRLLCDRVPYAVEAYPEGAKRHLSAESALFVRAVTEGMFGIMPEGLSSFSFTPYVPKGMEKVSLSKIRICGGCYDIKVNRQDFAVYRNGQKLLNGKTENKRVIVK